MDQTMLNCAGREFSETEIELVKEIVRMYPHLSRSELAATICENIGWTTHAGKSKERQCGEFLDRLSDEGVINLPKRIKKRKNGPTRLLEIEPPAEEISESITALPIEIQIVDSKQEMKRWRSYIDKYHLLGDKKAFGAQMYYFVKSGGRELGCLQFSASAWSLTARDLWIGWSETERKERLHLIVNNSRFLILPWVKVGNLASKALGMVAKRIKKDWLTKYCYEPVLLETFVDTEKFRGTCYKAANWIYVGQTAGRGRMDRRHQNAESIKAIYMYPLTEDFRAYLKGEKAYKVVEPDE
jgi:hypothetical protein